MGYFQLLIKNYSLLEKPLKDLANMLEVPKGASKRVYQNATQSHKLRDQWTAKHDKAFTILKLALMSVPVVKPPKYDGSLFIVTTDG